ncbi:2-hydroxyacylsphingosine 1-beta-galactosyltransferase-like [Prorops nasuta]|uniref:2-hydroxyacylsphingosine 1-beta-galactosyltransferase-like n=1 Tax=Prorops nasuta TaxID=863751 RepID=UPI0034CD1D07
MWLIKTCLCLSLIKLSTGSILTKPPQSALIVAFEDIYDFSLLANTLSDQGIDSTLLIPSKYSKEVYQNLVDVEVIELNCSIDKPLSLNWKALQACESLLQSNELFKRVDELKPTFTIFPALRHDACLLPWAKSFDSLPVIYIRNKDEELYVFHNTGLALPIHHGGFWSGLSAGLGWRSTCSSAKNDYVLPAQELVKKHTVFPVQVDDLYRDVRLVLWGSDNIIRSDFAQLSQLLVQVGCHHCRGAQPLDGSLHKPVIEFRSGTVAVLLDQVYESLVREIAEGLSQGRQGQAVIWKSKIKNEEGGELPENLFIREDIDRQDLIGYSRTRVVLSHCGDSELLEAAFHGTPVICLARDARESENGLRVEELRIGQRLEGGRSISSEEMVQWIKRIEENAEYREKARRVSVAIRDSQNPASDRLIYWLGRLARTKGEEVDLLAGRKASAAVTLREDTDFAKALVYGFALGLASTVACFLLRNVFLSFGRCVGDNSDSSGRSRKLKGRYES